MTSPRPVSTPDPRWTDRVLSEAEARSALALSLIHISEPTRPY